MVQAIGSQVDGMEIREIEISKIVINRRMRRTDEDRIKDLTESIKGIQLLHPISVAQKGETYILLDGSHRIRSFELLKRDYPCDSTRKQ